MQLRKERFFLFPLPSIPCRWLCRQGTRWIGGLADLLYYWGRRVCYWKFSTGQKKYRILI